MSEPMRSALTPSIQCSRAVAQSTMTQVAAGTMTTSHAPTLPPGTRKPRVSGAARERRRARMEAGQDARKHAILGHRPDQARVPDQVGEEDDGVAGHASQEGPGSQALASENLADHGEVARAPALPAAHGREPRDRGRRVAQDDDRHDERQAPRDGALGAFD